MARRKPPPPAEVEGMDKKEVVEREEAAQAYFGEDPDHFVRYMESCVNLSIASMQDIRDQQDECWRVYNEEEPTNFSWKEPWQSRVIVPKPFSSGQMGMGLIRKAFEMEFLSVQNEIDQKTADFCRKLMMIQLSRNFANFPINFSDASGMGLVIGQSMEMIPQWQPGRGVYIDLIEPWKIHRDPDALSRKPQSGTYWVHQEYLPLHQLREYEKNERYINISGITGSTQSKDPRLQEAEIARRKNMLYVKGPFTYVLTSEFWGTILDKRGEVLLPKGTFTIGADRVISSPRASYYPSLRWPGISFSPLPNLLRFGGRGLIQGIITLWYLMCNLMSLHADNLNWIVNPMIEIDVHSLVNQSDIDIYPGKIAQCKGTIQGHQVMRPVDMRSQTADVLANLNKADMMSQEGLMMTYAAFGLPGYRQEVTAREASQNLEQSLTVVGNIGKNLEDGALEFINAAWEVIQINMTYEELARLMGQEVAEQYRDEASPTGLTLPNMTTGSFKVSGISAMMRDQEILSNMANFLPLFEKPIFAAFVEPYNALKSWVRRAGLQDENILVTEDKALQVAEAQQAQQDAAIEQLRRKELAEAMVPEAQAQRFMAQAQKFMADAERALADASFKDAQAQAQALKLMAEAEKLRAEAEKHMADADLKDHQALLVGPQAKLALADANLKDKQAKEPIQISKASESKKKVESRQYGGPVEKGKPYVVGEKGPELFVPKQAGTIVPNRNDEINKIAGILQANQEKNFVQRIMKPDLYPNLPLPEGPGEHGTHLMSSAQVGNRHIVYPEIVQDSNTGNLKRLGRDEAIQHALKTGEYIQFNTPEEATWFGENYKKIWGW